MPSKITTANRPAHLHGFIRWAATATNAELETCREPMVWDRDIVPLCSDRWFQYGDLIEVVDAELKSRGFAVNPRTNKLVALSPREMRMIRAAASNNA